jgi:deoxycytidylate deaminase
VNAGNSNNFAELVFGLVYPIGVDIEPVLSVLRDYLSQLGYKARIFRISDYLQSLSLGIEFDDSNPLDLMNALMDAGNKARRTAEFDDILAVAAINDIFISRSKDEKDVLKPLNNVAHIVRSLKRPEEVFLLRDVYRPGFFLIGVAADDDEQIDFLVNRKGLTTDEASKIMARDQDEKLPSGQRTRDTFYLADVFVQLSTEKYKEQLKRFLDLVFGNPFRTPFREEHAMFIAYSSSARSAQLGRQVGAAIASTEGDVLAVGFNEVPAAGGGPYWEGDKKDHRDHKLEKDPNAEQRALIINSVIDKLAPYLLLVETAEPLLRELFQGEFTGTALESKTEAAKKTIEASIVGRDAVFDLIGSSELKQITEYGRAVHAEMDALLTCARLGLSVKGKILYTTTFPCHNCTRHIIAAGISKVVYIEPYPKSKAKDLHDDAITFDSEDAEETQRIPFVPFVGVGPRRYLEFFLLQPSTKRKTEDGMPIKWDWHSHTGPRTPMLPYNYVEREEKLIVERKKPLTKVLEGENGEGSFEK